MVTITTNRPAFRAHLIFNVKYQHRLHVIMLTKNTLSPTMCSVSGY